MGQGHRIKRTTVELDVNELEDAKEVLGTRTARETINAALREVNRRAKLARAAAFIARGELDAITPDELKDLRRSRYDSFSASPAERSHR